MLVAQCPNCSAKYRASQELLDSYGGFFRCGKCDTKFNYYDQFSSPSENITGFSRDESEEENHWLDLNANEPESEPETESESESESESYNYEPVDYDSDGLNLDTVSNKDEHNIVFNSYDDIGDELSEPQLVTRETNLDIDSFTDSEKLIEDTSEDDFHVLVESKEQIDETALDAEINANTNFVFHAIEIEPEDDSIQEETATSTADGGISSIFEVLSKPEDADSSIEELIVSGQDAESEPEWFSSTQLDDTIDEVDHSLISELEQEYQQERSVILGEEGLETDSDYFEEKLAPVLPQIDAEKAGIDYKISILDDVEEDTKVIGSFGALWLAATHIVKFLFWSLIVLSLVALLIYQFKPRLSTDLQEKIDNAPITQYLCKTISCERGLEVISPLEVVVSRMDIFPTPSEPANVSLFILNRFDEPQRFPVIKLSLKNLQGSTVGQRFYKPADYLTNPDASIPAGNIGKVILKLDNPPEKAVGFEVGLL